MNDSCLEWGAPAEQRLFEIGELVPVSIRSRESDRTIAGHVAIGKKALVLIMVHEIIEPSPDFAAGAFAGKEQERKEIAAYVHENLAPRAHVGCLLNGIDTFAIGKGGSSMRCEDQRNPATPERAATAHDRRTQ